MTDRSALSALVASRICHDLISPIGAIGNGLELVQMSAGAGSPTGSEEMELITDCAQTASESLQFMRIAFGARPADEAVSVREIATISAAYFRRRKVFVNWEEAQDESIRFRHAQILLMMALCAVGTMPRGGILTTAPGRADHQNLGWTIAAEGMRVTDRFSELMTTAPDIVSLRPGEVHHGLLWQYLSETGMRPVWSKTKDGGTIGQSQTVTDARQPRLRTG